jgi:hypothetical protein
VDPEQFIDKFNNVIKLRLAIIDMEKSPFRNHTELIKKVIQEVCFGEFQNKSIEDEIIMIPPVEVPDLFKLVSVVSSQKETERRRDSLHITKDGNELRSVFDDLPDIKPKSRWDEEKEAVIKI